MMREKWLTLAVAMVVCVGCAQISKKSLPPLLQLTFTKSTIEPGHAMKVIIKSDQIVQAELQTQGQTIRMEPLLGGDGLIQETFISMPLDTIPDAYSVTLTAIDQRGIVFKKYYSYRVVARSPFKVSRLWIKNFGKYNFSSESAIMRHAREAIPLEKRFGTVSGFLWPVRGRISEVFGVKRIYNGGKNTWYHGGIDIAAPGGTVIVAPADGIVLLTRQFEAHGNTTLIYHGFGLVTTYLHQKEILVHEGQTVRQGEKIGKVGTTGASTGNHLHFQINIHHVKADPFDFLPGK